MSYLTAQDLIFNDDDQQNIHSGGFSVKSIFMKSGFSPIKTLNTNQLGGSNKVSDLFSADLVVPNWAYSHDTHLPSDSNFKYDSDEENETIDDELYDKLLDLAKKTENNIKNKFKKTKKNIGSIKFKKGGSKKQRS